MKENTEISARILQIIENQGITPNLFAKKLGYERSQTVYDVINGKSAPSFDFFRRFEVSEFSESIDISWLLTGNGQMLKLNAISTHAQPEKTISESTDLRNKYTNNSEISKIYKPKGIPLIPVEAMAGYGNGDVQVMDYDIQENYIITPELEGKGIKYLIRVSGSSMTPKYNNGDLLACRPITDISFIQWGKVYVLDPDQGPIVKSLYQCNPVNKDCLECHSDNHEKYPPFEISRTSIRRIAIVVGVLRLE